MIPSVQMVLKPGPYLDELTNTQGRDMPTVLPLLEEGGYDVMLEAQ